jgi:serine phosphatase RsbU (regulator of sigma subunit)
MKLNRFRMIVVGRVLLLGASIYLFFLLSPKPEFVVTKIMVVMLVIYQLFRLILFMEKTNRELNRFFESIQNDDFTQTFLTGNMGDSFAQLKQSFDRVTRKFINLRFEKEEHFRYLQTVVEHVGVGLISYTADGEVELINKAAKQLFNIGAIKNIRSLEPLSKSLVETLLSMKTGEKASHKIRTEQKTIYLSMNATQFIVKDKRYTLLSLQDIHAEIEREHMAKELEIAWNVQKSLLPGSNPDFPGFDIAAMCKPAKEVGGDYYDYFPLAPGKLAIVIGDVSGKGIPASFYMTLTKGFIQSNMTENSSPRDVLIKVNELMYKTIDRRAFVTMFIAVVDGKSKRIVCARAGHNPAIHFASSNTKFTLIKPEGIALGLRNTDAFSDCLREYELSLKENDRLLLYTDGLTETLDAHGHEFGESGLMHILLKNREKNSETLVEKVFERVQEISENGQQDDDMTMLALRVVPENKN